MFVQLKNHEIRGDGYVHWGISDLYFETTTDGEVLRQIEAYEIGIRLRYDQDNRSDRYGMLNQGKLDTIASEFKPLSEDQFWHIWQKRSPLLCQTLDDDKMSIVELQQNEIDLPISDRLYWELFSTELIVKLQDLPMKYGPIEEAEEALILNEGLEAAIQIIQSSLMDFSRDARLELDSVIDFIKGAKEKGKAIQFWM